MWNLNDLPDQIMGHDNHTESEQDCCFSPVLDFEDEKGKRVGSVCDSSSSTMVIQADSDEEDVIHMKHEIPVTHQLFPVDESEVGSSTTGDKDFQRAHWMGVNFGQHENLGGGKSNDAAAELAAFEEEPPWSTVEKLAVSRCHFYRRTGRWESHIW